MLCEPALKVLVLHVAVPPLTAIAEQPPSVVLSAVNATFPVGAVPVTVAVKVTLAPAVDGVPEVASAVVLIALLITCVRAGELDEPALLASPLYVATRLCEPTLRLLVLHVAVLAFAVPPLNATVEQPLSVVPSAVNPTLPVGALPVTVAVNVTLAPSTDGVPEVASVVVELVLPPLSVTLSMKVVLSLGSVPVKAMVCAPVPATENGTLKLLKLVLAGDTKLPTGVPSTLTCTG